MKKFLLTIGLGLVLSALVGCGGGSSTDDTSTTVEKGLTTNTDNTKLNRSYEGKDFLSDADGNIGEVRFRSCTDGDTTNFYSGNEKIKVRFLGVNTPESTAKIQPWGVPASVYVCSIVSDPAVTIVLENDISVWDKIENSSAQRNLAFVWYKKGNADFRLLNLELVEMGYSLNQLFVDSTICPYTSAFEAAEAYAKAAEIKIHGELDPMYDYTGDIYTITLREVIHNYEEYGKTTTSSGKQLRIKALVVGMIGDNMILRDLNPGPDDDEDDMLTSLYAYAGYNTSLATAVGVGDVVNFYCRATKFNDAIQLSDLKTSFVDRKYPFEILAKGLTGPTTDYPFVNLDCYDLDTAGYTSYSDFAPYEMMYVETEVTVRMVQSGDVDVDGNIIEGTEWENYFNRDANNNYTLYANCEGLLHGNANYKMTLNLRIDGQMYPYLEPTQFEVGKTYKCRGYLAPYFEKYQLMLFNNAFAELVE